MGYHQTSAPRNTYSNPLSTQTSVTQNFFQGGVPDTPVVGNVNMMSAVVGASSLGGNCLQWGIVGNAATGTMWSTLLVPVFPDALYGQSHYAEVIFKQLLSTGGARIGAGLAVMASNISSLGCHYYFLEVLSTTRAMYLQRKDGSGFVTFSAAFGSVADGDKMRLEAKIFATKVTLNVYQNGVLIATADDSSALRLTTGMPGLCAIDGPQGAGTVCNEMTNFKCGLST